MHDGKDRNEGDGKEGRDGALVNIEKTEARHGSSCL
jgi:hypothetical protein